MPSRNKGDHTMPALTAICTDLGIENIEYPVIIDYTLWLNWAIARAENLHKENPNTHYSITRRDTLRSWDYGMSIYYYLIFKYDESAGQIYNTKDGRL